MQEHDYLSIEVARAKRADPDDIEFEAIGSKFYLARPEQNLLTFKTPINLQDAFSAHDSHLTCRNEYLFIFFGYFDRHER